MTSVKRRYDASARRQRAAQMRRAIVDAANGLLLDQGYAATSIAQVAHGCGISVESVYRRFPGKPALVRAVVEEALLGIGPVPAEVRSDALASDSLDTLLTGWGRLAAEVAPRVAPILLLVQTAALHDPDLARLHAELDEDRRRRMRDNARRLHAAGLLPSGMSLERATDLLWTYSSPQVYDLLVHRCGWRPDEYAAYVTNGLRGHLAAMVA